MKIEARMVIMSHLSDVQEMLNFLPCRTRVINTEINFVKWLLLNYGDLSEEIDEKKLTRIYSDIENGKKPKEIKTMKENRETDEKKVRVWNGNRIMAKIGAVCFCIALGVVLMTLAYNAWSKYGDYTLADFCVSLGLHGGFAFIVWLALDKIIDIIYRGRKYTDEYL